MKPLLAFLCFAGAMAAQDAPAKPQAAQRMEITLERQQGSQWKAVDPGFVFDKGDRVRFRFRANFDGYLYVTDYGTSGNYSLLFPREETGRENRIESGKEYQVPATQAWFRIDGPPGHDIVYWLVSPMAVSNGAEPAQNQAAAEDPAAALRRLHFSRPGTVHRLERRSARHSRDRELSRESEGRTAREIAGTGHHAQGGQLADFLSGPVDGAGGLPVPAGSQVTSWHEPSHCSSH